MKISPSPKHETLGIVPNQEEDDWDKRRKQGNRKREYIPPTLDPIVKALKQSQGEETIVAAAFHPSVVQQAIEDRIQVMFT